MQAALAGALGFVLAGIAAVVAWHLGASRQHAELARFGDTMAREVAFLAAEPLLRQDSIGLGTLANRMAAFDEVRSITIHSIDDRLLAAAGNTGGGEDVQVWLGPITVEDTVAGHVRVVLDSSRFRPFAGGDGGGHVASLARRLPCHRADLLCLGAGGQG